MMARFFVDRPIFATVISVVIVLAGLVAMVNLPVAQYPEVAPPIVVVTAFYPGANSLTVRDTVAAPIEEQVSGVENNLYMSSQCTNDGAYKLTVTFKLGTDADLAQVLVQNRLSLALPVIPALVQNEGVTCKKSSANTLLIVNLETSDSESYPTDEAKSIFLSNYATISIKDELLRLSGVADISYLGQRDYSLRVWLDAEKMPSLGLSGMDVVNAITQQNVQVAAGQIGQQPVPKGQRFQLTINTQGRLSEPNEFADIILKGGNNLTTTSAAGGANIATGGTTGPNGAKASTANAPPIGTTAGQTGAVQQDTPIVRIRDVVTQSVVEHVNQNGEKVKEIVPRVELGSQQYDQACTLDGKPSVALSVYQLPGSNALDTANNIYAKMKELKKRFPPGMNYHIVYDTTPFIKESVNEVFNTLRDAVILVAIVVLVFLQDWRAMILPMIDVPVSLIGTFAVMKMLGFTLNNLTLFGLVLAIGIVVDDAIVVLENIERLIATGLDARTATIQAMDEITGPVLAITLVLSSVFVPCCFIGGVSGQFFLQFAVTIAVSTIISAINALTMTPARAVLIFKTEEGHEHKREALPWWFFGILLGSLMVWKGAWLTHLAGVTLPEAAPDSKWMPYVIQAMYLFLPGMMVGGLIGFVIIGPVNIVLGYFFRAFNKAFDVATQWYGSVVAGTLRVSALVMVVYAGLLGLTAWEFMNTPTGFVPEQDKGYLLLNVRLADSASVARTEEVMHRIEDIVLKGDLVEKKPAIPENASPTERDAQNKAWQEKCNKAAADDSLLVTGNAIYHKRTGINHTVGISGQSLILNANASNLGSMYVMLQPFDERKGHDDQSSDALARLLQKELEDVKEAKVSVFSAPPIDGLGTTGGFKLIVKDLGNVGLTELQDVSDRIVKAGNQTPGLERFENGSGANTPWLYLDMDRTRCVVEGLQVSDNFNTLQVYLGSYYVNNYNNFGRTWQVNVQADQSFRAKESDIKRLQVRNSQNQMVQLGSVMQVHDTYGPLMVLRYNMHSAVAITANPAPGTGSGEALTLMRETAEKELPQSMGVEWTDLAYLQSEAGNTAMIFFCLAVIFVFLVLAAQYENWKLPLAVILVVPMCLLCSVVGVQIAGMEVTIFTQIGFVVLVGLASKNAILIVEFAKQQQEQGVPRREAILQACRLRLRPILMTSFAFIFGVVPLVVAEGAGSEMRRSLGTAVFSGMVGVTLFGIFLTPVFYYVIQGFGTPVPVHAHGSTPTEHSPSSPSAGMAPHGDGATGIVTSPHASAPPDNPPASATAWNQDFGKRSGFPGGTPPPSA